MIKIIPGLKLEIDIEKRLISNLNSYFSIDDGFSLQFSYPGRYKYCSPYVGKNLHLVSETVSNHKIYNDLENEIVKETVTEKEIFEFSNQRYYYENSKFPGKTVIFDRVGGSQWVFEGDFGFVQLDFEDKMVLKNRTLFTCVSKKTGSIIWQCERDRKDSLKDVVYDKEILFTHENVSEYNTVLKFVDINTGKEIRRDEIECLGKIVFSDEDQLILVGVNNDKSIKRYVLVCYSIKKRSQSLFEMDTSFRPAYFKVFSKLGVGLYCENETESEVWGSSEKACGKLGIVDFMTAKVKSEIELPNVATPCGFSYDDNNKKMYSVGIARMPWPNNYEQMLILDNADLFCSSHDIITEEFINKPNINDLKEEGAYRIFFEEVCQNFFQLHRKLSVALRDIGVKYGFSYGNPDKNFDAEFKSLVCDISNHALNDKEKLAIVHLCEALERELTENDFASGYDPEVPIVIEPKFA